MTARRSPSADALADRRRQVVELHHAGSSFRAIAEALGISRSVAHEDYHRHLSEMPDEDRRFRRNRAEVKLDWLWAETARLFVIAARGTVERRADPATGEVTEHRVAPNHDRAVRLVERLVQVEDRRARLEGTDAPTLQRIQVVGEDDLDALAETYRQRLRLLDPAHPLVADRDPARPALGPG